MGRDIWPPFRPLMSSKRRKNEDERETSLQSGRAFIIQLLMQLQHLLV
jgi:hypothetical protein